MLIPCKNYHSNLQSPPTLWFAAEAHHHTEQPTQFLLVLYLRFFFRALVEHLLDIVKVFVEI